MTAIITVVGLGSGDENQLSLGTWKKLMNAKHVYLRTAHHPVVDMLRSHQLSYQTFDAVYEANDTFTAVYTAITAKLLIEAASLPEGEEIVYAVPGHPLVAERTVQLLKEACSTQSIELTILGGESFLDQAFLRLGFDPIEGFQLLDATQLNASLLHPQLHILIAQVYDQWTASEVKLTLMEVYPDDYPVVVAHSLGVTGVETITQLPLYELDRVNEYGNLSLIWVPRNTEESLQYRSFAYLQENVRHKHELGRSTLSQVQTHAGLRGQLLEKTDGLLRAIDEDDPQEMCEKLGDLLLQIMLHTQIEDEIGSFEMSDVIANLNKKMKLF